MATSEALPISQYPEEPKTYTSSISIKLKPYKFNNSLKDDDIKVFEWHTNVFTPPNTPVVPKPPVTEEEALTSSNANQQSAAPPTPRSNDLFMPAHTFDEKDDLKTSLDKFMSCERYHSQYHKMLQQGTHL
uniref:Uncharacterized protein n=1 Tax=Musca domestica TaxID=7370 RepID=T1PM55_MUSDO